SSDSSRGDRRHPAHDPQPGPIADLRAEAQQGRTSGEAAEEQVGPNLITPGRGLDAGSSVIGSKHDVIDHRHLTIALGTAVLPTPAPTTTASAASGTRATASATLPASAFGLGWAVGIVF